MVVPAHLAYLAIYNPTLGATDETVRDQIVYYYSHKLDLEREHISKNKHGASPQLRTTPTQDNRRDVDEKEEEVAQNERLRQVGLAQGMVNFVK